MINKKEYVTKSLTYNGRRYYVSAKTEAQAAAKLALKRKELEDGNNTVDSNIKIAVWGDKWLTTCKQDDVSPGWYKRMERILNNAILSEIGYLSLRDLRRIHIKELFNKYTGYSLSYQKKIYNITNEMLEEAVKNKLIKENPARGVDLPKAKEPERRRPLTHYEREILLRVAESHHAGVFLLIMLYCGLRPSEVARLKWGDIVDGYVYIRKAKSNAGIRRVPIPDPVKERLDPRGDHEYVCVNQFGNPYSEQGIARMWHSVSREMNILMGCKVYRSALVPPFPLAKDLSLYCLRHTYCTDLQKAGVPINVARVLMGHATLAMTAAIYTHTDTETLDEALVLINEKIKKDDK